MSDKPVIFISYSHKDEPERAPEGDIAWLTEIQSYIAPAVKGTYELWTDENIDGGADWELEIKAKLAHCDICILLVSRHSLASAYVIDIEIGAINERIARGETVQLYPIVLSTFPPEAAPQSLLALNLRPRLDRPLSGFSRHDRGVEISKIASEIVRLLGQVRPVVEDPKFKPVKPAYVHITGLPETAYERLVGREAELKRLDDAWADKKTNILSLVAEGGAGKSALANEWLEKLQVENYRDAEMVLGWSFYSQGSKERATSAEGFLNWALEKLGIAIDTTSAGAKGEAIAEALGKRRVLLMLDGVEPLQHGPGTQTGQLKDLGLRSLLRRFASLSPAEAHGLIVLSTRLAIADIARWNDSAAPIVDVEQLSDKAGAALLRDNGVWGTDKELQSAAREFGGHPLALGLLATFLKETQAGDARRRDHITDWVHDKENPRHGHAKRVMESYEKEWLNDQPALMAIMHMVGLFDRPASGDCLRALRRVPIIAGLTDKIVELDEAAWSRAVARLRDVRLLTPMDPVAPDALDAHALVREWFGERLKEKSRKAWQEAHGRLYENLRDTTKEGDTPTLEDFAPLYQAIAHGCRAGRHQEALEKIYMDRICKRRGPTIVFYSFRSLGAYGADLAAISWFFDHAYVTPVGSLTTVSQSWVLGVAAAALRAQARFTESIAAERTGLRMDEEAMDWKNAAISGANLSAAELVVGEIVHAIASAAKAVEYSDRSDDFFEKLSNRAYHANSLLAAASYREARIQFADAEQRQKDLSPDRPLLYSLRGYWYCDLLIANDNWIEARDRAEQNLASSLRNRRLQDIAHDTLIMGRSHLGLGFATGNREHIRMAQSCLSGSVEKLHAAGDVTRISPGLLARSAFRRSIGDWDGAARDLDEVEEIAEPGPMKLFLCDMALERARLAFARIEAFAPLNGMLESDNPPEPGVPSAEKIAELKEEAGKQIKIADEYIQTCGYHRRDEELAELQAVLKGERTFASLPPRV